MRSASAAERGVGRRGEEGAITAEFAVALPAVLLVLWACLIALVLGADQVRLADASGQAARLAARGVSAAEVRTTVRTLVPGAEVALRTREGLRCATVSVRRPVALLPAIRLTADHCALDGGR